VVVGEHWGDALVSLLLVWLTGQASIIMNSGVSAADLDVGRQRVHFFTVGCSIGLIYENLLLFLLYWGT